MKKITSMKQLCRDKVIEAEHKLAERDKRDRFVLSLHKEGYSMTAIANEVGISRSTVSRIITAKHKPKMRITPNDERVKVLKAACKEAGIPARIEWVRSFDETYGWSEEMAVQFRDEFPVPLATNTSQWLDMCFFIGPNRTPMFAYSGCHYCDYAGVNNGGLIEAFQKAQEVMQIMKRLLKESES